jgi:hypothetical protein
MTNKIKSDGLTVPDSTVHTDGSDSSYDLNGILTIKSGGSRSSIRNVIDRELHYFSSQSERSDLSLVFGEFPSPDWQPRGFSLGGDLLYHEETHETTILGRLRPPPAKKKDVKYVMDGDLRDPKQKVTIYIPRAEPTPESRAKLLAFSMFRSNLDATYLAILAKNSFLNNAVIERQATDIICSFIEPFLYYRLPSSGLSLVHGSAVSLNGSGVLLIGASDVGKTTLALELVSQGFAFLGDDLAIVDCEAKMMAYPKRIKLEERHPEVFPQLIERIREKLDRSDRVIFDRMVRSKSNMLFDYLPRPTISELIEKVKVERSCSLDAVILVRRGMISEPKVSQVDKETIERALTNGLFWEFDTQSWRHNQYAYCPSHAAGRDFIREEFEHHTKVSDIVSHAVGGAKAFELQLPPNFDIGQIGKLIEGLVRA